LAVKYSQFKKKTFTTRKEADTWTKKTKEEYKTGGIDLKIDINYRPDDKQWDGVLLIKQEG
jgi:hypothetical protein